MINNDDLANPFQPPSWLQGLLQRAQPMRPEDEESHGPPMPGRTRRGNLDIPDLQMKHLAVPALMIIVMILLGLNYLMLVLRAEQTQTQMQSLVMAARNKTGLGDWDLRRDFVNFLQSQEQKIKGTGQETKNFRELTHEVLDSVANFMGSDESNLPSAKDVGPSSRFCFFMPVSAIDSLARVGASAFSALAQDPEGHGVDVFLYPQDAISEALVRRFVARNGDVRLQLVSTPDSGFDLATTRRGLEQVMKMDRNMLDSNGKRVTAVCDIFTAIKPGTVVFPHLADRVVTWFDKNDGATVATIKGNKVKQSAMDMLESGPEMTFVKAQTLESPDPITASQVGQISEAIYAYP